MLAPLFIFLFFGLGLWAQSTPLIESSDRWVHSREGYPLLSVRTNFNVRRLNWVPFSQIPNHLNEILIQSEDRRYREHSGVDTIALISSIRDTLLFQKRRGGSTITMQLVGMLDPNLKKVNRSRTFYQKWKQIWAAYEYESSHSKEEILEYYWNLAPFRGEWEGVSIASRGIFRKDVSNLTEAESSILVAMLKFPNAPWMRIQKSACFIFQTYKQDTNCEAIHSISEPSLGFPLASPNFLGPLQGISDIPQITSIRFDLQKEIREIVKSNIRLFEQQNVKNASILVLENGSGRILSYFSFHSDPKTNQLDLVKSKRQIGSTIKPFLYGEALESNKITLATLLQDQPTEISETYGIYQPMNYDKKYHGTVSAKVALASSLNLPAVQIFQILNLVESQRKWEILQFLQEKEIGYYGPAFALGSLEVSLWNLTRAYSMIANNGILVEPHWNPDKTGEGKVFWKPSSAFLIQSALSDVEARGLGFGWDNVLHTSYPSFAKTGTSQDMRDNWCLGSSVRFTIGVWVGNADGSPMKNVSGISGAGPIWRQALDFLEKDLPPMAFEAPNSIVYQGGIPFVTGSEPKENLPIMVEWKKVRILNPPSESRFGLDPEIPPDRQVIFIRASSYKKGYYWVRNKEERKEAIEAWAWLPVIGNHTFTLEDDKGQTLDQIELQVR